MNLDLGQNLRAELVVIVDGVPIAGLSPKFGIRRRADGKWWNFVTSIWVSTLTEDCKSLLVELGDGVYASTFDPSEAIVDFGNFSIRYFWTDADGYDLCSEEPIRVGRAALAEKVLTHRLRIDQATSTMTIFEADAVRPAAVYDLTDKDGAAIKLTGTGPVNRGMP